MTENQIDALVPKLESAGPLDALEVGQIGLLVHDLEASVDRWSAILGCDDWLIYRYAPDTVPHLRFRGAPGRFSLLLALSSGRPQVELIQPLEGPSVYDDWLERRGEGVHHVAAIVESIADLAPPLEAAGYPKTQWGSGYGLDGDGGFAYFDTVADLGIWFELLEVPARRRPPDAVR